MTLRSELELIGEPCPGSLSSQRTALKALALRAGWPDWSHLANGKPTWNSGHLSLSHGGGWVVAIRGAGPVGIDVEAPTSRLENVRRRYVGAADQPLLKHHGDNLDSLCRLWSAKEAAFKVFGTGLDFLTGLRWDSIGESEAVATATLQSVQLHIQWHRLEEPEAWLAIAEPTGPRNPT